MGIRAGSHAERNPYLEFGDERERRIAMAGLFLSLRWAHVVAGSMALMLFRIPVIAPKGGRAHVRAGWIYVFCMSVVVVTAFVMSALAFSVPLAIRQFTR